MQYGQRMGGLIRSERVVCKSRVHLTNHFIILHVYGCKQGNHRGVANGGWYPTLPHKKVVVVC